MCVRARGGLGPPVRGFLRRSIYRSARPMPRYTEINLGFCHLSACAAAIVYSIPPAGVHRRTGEQVSGTTRICDPVRERANKVFGKRSRDCSTSSSRLAFPVDLWRVGLVVFNAVFSDPSPQQQRLLPLHQISTSRSALVSCRLLCLLCYCSC